MQPQVKIHETRQGIKYALFAQQEIISDEIRKNNYWNVYNLEIADIILSERDNCRVIDVGSGMGAFTIPLAVKYLKKHIFDCFEPVPALNAQLNANALLNQLDNVRCHRVGVWDKNEIIDSFIFDLSSMNHGSFALSRDNYVNRNLPIPNETDVFELRTLDDYRFARVGLIKVTVSGTELEVVKGIEKTVEVNELPPLMIESWNVDWNKDRQSEVLELIKKYGYKQVISRRDFIFAFNNENLCKKVEARLNEQRPGSLVVFK
jgi:FkbM family methyltransferase